MGTFQQPNRPDSSGIRVAALASENVGDTNKNG